VAIANAWSINAASSPIYAYKNARGRHLPLRAVISRVS
jgi:hypothetical protein